MISQDELAKHNSRHDAWMALGHPPLVYDVTTYLDYHPGGRGEVLRGAGTDATQLFNEYHSWINFNHILSSVLIGTLDRRPGGGDLRAPR